MQKWDYMTIQISSFGMAHDKLAPQYMNEQELRDWKKISISRLIKQLGEDGWEMTGTISVSQTNEHYLFFKRPKP
ncbi:MAG: hypothetical protein ACR2H5_01505 [Ktedonobacteraceae bacterium]